MSTLASVPVGLTHGSNHPDEHLGKKGCVGPPPNIPAVLTTSATIVDNAPRPSAVPESTLSILHPSAATEENENLTYGGRSHPATVYAGPASTTVSPSITINPVGGLPVPVDPCVM